jgi:hypothetical protein
VAIILGAVVFGVYDRRWDLYMINVPDIHDLPLNSSGYTIEPLPFQITVSFVRGHDLYYADEHSIVYVSHDRDSPEKSLALGKSQVASPRLLFVSSRGTLFLGGNDSRMERSTNRGKSWEQVLSVPTWRMDEDEATGTLYVGNYSPRHHPIEMATVYKSMDEGETWQPVFTDNRLDHIHTVRYDPIFDRMYIAAGDDSTPRGQAWSDDNGKSWKWIANGRGNGHTDLAFSDHFVFWGSDDWYGRIIRSTRAQVQEGETILFAKRHQIWWVVARNQQIYAGTFLEHPKSQSGAFLIASDNEGHTWQKLIEVGQAGPKLKAFLGESRRLTSDGWVYFSTSEGQSYRVRKTSSE